jgi:DNA-binding transcriptional LysR family regulator
MRLNDLDLNLLRTFVFVADERSFTSAGKKLFLEQSAVSKAVKRLEEAVGSELFKRTKRRVQLTSKGQSLLPIAREVLQNSSDFLRIALNRENEISGNLRFGASSPFSFMILPEVISQISVDYSKLWPQMFTGVTEDLVRRVKQRDLEFAFISYEGTRVKELEYIELGSFDYQLVVAKNILPQAMNSFIGSREVNDSDMPKLPTFSKLKKLNPNIQIKYSANDMMAYKEMVLRGLGVGLLPALLVKDDVREKRLKVIYPKIQLSFPYYMVRHASFPLSHEALRMIEIFKQVASH